MTKMNASTSVLKPFLSGGGRVGLVVVPRLLLLSLLLLVFGLSQGDVVSNKLTVDTTADAIDYTTIDDVDSTDDIDAMTIDDYYNVNETRGEFEFRIQPYPIPIKTTTYVDFVFNLPDDLPPLVHIVFGEALVSQPKHLHHFVLTGCSTKLADDVQAGTPIDRPPSDCNIPLGGWAPGRPMFGGSPDLSIGVAIGKAMGIQAVQLNIHYTDGVYEDEESKTYTMATDGIKVYYTTDLRPYTSMSKSLITIGWGPPELFIPAETSRYFVTRTCMVNTKCKDTTTKQLQKVAAIFGKRGSSEAVDAATGAGAGAGADADADNDAADADPQSAMMAQMLANISCPTIKPFCGMGGDMGPLVQQLCPVTCGFCEDEGDTGTGNPRNPTSYRATSINYHAHLLGSEMYATLLRPAAPADDQDEDQDDVGVSSSTSMTQKRSSSGNNNNNNMIVKDLKSSEFWYYDNQVSSPMDKEYKIQVHSNSDNVDTKESIELVTGVEIVPGDQIQTTCVYNSMYRENNTHFGLSTYDEMCIIDLQITFETPPNNDVIGIGLTADLNLRTFSCDVMVDDTNEDTTDNDEDTDTRDASSPVTKQSILLSDVWQGILDVEEDPRNIWSDHPITSTDMCTFPVGDYVVFDSFMTSESRNCPLSMNITSDKKDFDSSSICYAYETETDGDIEFLTNTIAGYTCVGGTYDEKDSNEPPMLVGKEECLAGVDGNGGTSYDAYTCEDIQYWLQNQGSITDQVSEYLRTNWWQPKCCRVRINSSVELEDGDGDGDGETSADTTTTTTMSTAAAEESSSSSIAIVAASSVVIIIMTTTMMVL